MDRHLQSAAQNVLDLFGEFLLIRWAMLGLFNAAVLKNVHLFGKLTTFFEQARHRLEDVVAIGEGAAEPLVDGKQLCEGLIELGHLGSAEN